MQATDLSVTRPNLIDHKPIIKQKAMHPHPGVFVLSKWNRPLKEIKKITHFLGPVIIDCDLPFEFNKDVVFMGTVVTDLDYYKTTMRRTK